MNKVDKFTKAPTVSQMNAKVNELCDFTEDTVAHVNNMSNPHNVTPSLIGAAKESHTHDDRYYTESEMDTKLAAKVNSSLIGAASGIASLGTDGKVPSSQLPLALTLGETSSTAYRGDRGKTAYDHSQKTSGNPHRVTKSEIGLGSVENKSSATIREELTKKNVTDALGYTPLQTVTPSDINYTDYGKDGTLDLITRSYINNAASNKSFGLPADAILIEYSRDGGVTWLDYEASDADKRNLFAETEKSRFYIGNASSPANNSTQCQLRVTIDDTDDRYVILDAVYCRINVNGATVYMNLEANTKGAPDTFTTIFTGERVSGSNGRNIRFFQEQNFGANSSTAPQKLRLTLYQTAINTKFPSASISDIRYFGHRVLSLGYTSTAVRNYLQFNQLYGWDDDYNATFPAEVTATAFNGPATKIVSKEATANINRPVFFAYNDDTSRVCYDDSFTYNPSTKILSVKNANIDVPVEYIKGTQTAATGSWTGNTRATELTNGQLVLYWLPYAGSGNATLDLTLANGSTTGAKPIYRYATTYVTTQYPANSRLLLVYDATVDAWYVQGDYGSTTDTYNRTRWQNSIYALADIPAARVCVGTASGYQVAASGVVFDISYPILYNATAIDATEAGTNMYLTFPSVNYSSTHSVTGGAVRKAIYLVGTLNGSSFTINSTVFTATVPTTDDGLYYIPLGIMTSASVGYFYSRSDIYAHKDGAFRRV